MSNEQVAASNDSTDNQNDPIVSETVTRLHGDYAENDIYTLENLALSVGRTLGGRHTITLGFINREGKFSHRVPVYVNVGVQGVEGLKAMGCQENLVEGFKNLLLASEEKMREETLERMEQNKTSRPQEHREVKVVRSPGKTERERMKLEEKKREAKASEPVSSSKKK